MTTETDTKARWTRVAGATKPCPETTKVPHLVDSLGRPCINALVHVVPEIVRLPCPNKDARVSCERLMSSKTPCSCQGRGWTVSTDGWEWWRAILPLFADVILSKAPHGFPVGYFCRIVHSQTKETNAFNEDPEIAVLTAIEGALDQMEGIEYGN